MFQTRPWESREFPEFQCGACLSEGISASEFHPPGSVTKASLELRGAEQMEGGSLPQYL